MGRMSQPNTNANTTTTNYRGRPRYKGPTSSPLAVALGAILSVVTSLLAVFAVAASAVLYQHVARLHAENAQLKQHINLLALDRALQLPEFPSKALLLDQLVREMQGDNTGLMLRCAFNSTFQVLLGDTKVEERVSAQQCADINNRLLEDQQSCSSGSSLVDIYQQEKKEEQENDLPPHLAYRIISGIFLAACIGSIAYIQTNFDNLPKPLSNIISRYLRVKDVGRQAPLSKWMAYRLGRWFSWNRFAKPLALLYLTVLLILVGAFALYTVSDQSFFESAWEAVAGAGIDWTFAIETKVRHTFLVRVTAMILSIGGMLVTALMLGIVSEAISEGMDEMKKGRSDALESEHTLILGWSDKLLPIIDQICLANESEGGKAIVILSEREKFEMEEDIKRHHIDQKGSYIICRTGNPLLYSDLEKVSVATARSVIVLANHQSPEQSDARALRIVLSLMGVDERLKEQGGLRGHVVVEVMDIDNETLVKMVGQDKVQTVVAHDIIGRLMIQCARQPGLATVWEEIMGFEGCEFYLQEWRQCTGRPFGEVLLSFPDAVPLGIKSARTNDILMNPSDDYIVQPNDQILVLAEDENSYRPGVFPVLDPGPNPFWSFERQKEIILFCGWRRDMDDIISVLDDFVSPGSELYLYNSVPIQARKELLIQGGLDPDKDLKNIRLIYEEPYLVGDLVMRRKLEGLEPTKYSAVLILADESATGENIADADSRNLATLLLLRDIQLNHLRQMKQTLIDSRGWQSWQENMLEMAVNQTVIISEILDSKTRHLISDLNISEFVLSNELVSMALAMVAEDAEVNSVLGELFTEKGNELYVHPAEKYLEENEVLCFQEVQLRARLRRELVIGYKANHMDKPVLNPPDKLKRFYSREHTQAFVIVAEEFVIDTLR